MLKEMWLNDLFWGIKEHFWGEIFWWWMITLEGIVDKSSKISWQGQSRPPPPFLAMPRFWDPQPIQSCTMRYTLAWRRHFSLRLLNRIHCSAPTVGVAITKIFLTVNRIRTNFTLIIFTICLTVSDLWKKKTRKGCSLVYIHRMWSLHCTMGQSSY